MQTFATNESGGMHEEVEIHYAKLKLKKGRSVQLFHDLPARVRLDMLELTLIDPGHKLPWACSTRSLQSKPPSLLN